MPSLLMIIYSATPTVGIKKGSLRIEKRDVSFMIRIINDTTLGSKKVSVTFLLRNIIVTL